MSTVLWANVLSAGRVKSDQSDHVALYKHAEKLDAMAQALDLPSFMSICDTTDQEISMGERELPAGMASSDELMAAQGSWMPMEDAITLLTHLRDHVVAEHTRFGLFGHHHAEVVEELNDVLAFVQAEAPHAEEFNFSVVS